MKILLISPCRGPNIKNQKSVMMPQLALDLVAGLTPSEHSVTIVEEEYSVIDLDADCDLVGLSCMTSNAPRGYDLAGEFKKRGKTVVMGGVHPTILPDEALQHVDAVVVGEAEGAWPRLLQDFAQDRLQKRYHEPDPPLDVYIPVKPRKGIRKSLFHVVPVMTTRGCPYNCDFCCVHDIYGSKVRHVAVENVVRYMLGSGGRIFMFLDDNIMGDPRYAKELFRAIIPLRIKWVGQASLSFVADKELLRLARESGCGALFFGIESVSEGRLAKMRKSIPKAEKLGEATKTLREAGIYPFASVVFGFDEDTLRTFPETLEFLEKNLIGSASFNILTPYPGTQIYRQLKEEGRIFTEDWKYYNHSTAVYRPKNLTIPELLAGRLWVRREFTKASATLRRLPSNRAHPLLHLVVNGALRRSAGDQIRNFTNRASELCRMESRARGEEEACGPDLFSFEDIVAKSGWT